MIRDTVMETPQVTPDDWKLLSAYVQGDEGAFELLVKKYFPMLYAMAVRQLGDEHLAKDVAQSVFIILSSLPSRILENFVGFRAGHSIDRVSGQ